jgi:flagellar motor switch protein FliM
MSSEILSQNDIDLLLGGQASVAAVETRKPGREVALYDFRRPHRVSKERLRTLEAMYERLVKSLEGWIMGRVRTQVELTLQGVEQLSFADFTLSLTTPCCSFLGDIRDSGGQQAVIDFGQEFSFFLVDRLLGGRGTPVTPQRTLTPIERMVVHTVADRVTSGVQEVWEEYVSLDLSVAGFESVPEILRATSGDAPVLVASVEVRAGGLSSVLSICLPFAVLDTFFADANSHRRLSVTGSEDERRASRRLVEGSLRHTALPIAARLPEFRISMRNLSVIQEGSVLATGISRNSDIEVLVSGRARFNAKPARVGRKLAMSITESLEPVGSDEEGAADINLHEKEL